MGNRTAMVVKADFDILQEYSESKPDESAGFDKRRHSNTFGEDSQFARNKKRHQELSTKFNDRKQAHNESQCQLRKCTHQSNLVHGSEEDDPDRRVKDQREPRIYQR